MTDKKLSILIEGKDRLSPVLKTVASSAQQATSAIQTGNKAAASSYAQVNTAALSTRQALAALANEQRAGATAMQSFQSAQQNVAIGAAALGASFTMSANAFASQQQAVAALGRIYGETADQMVAFANNVQNTSVFSNDEALEAVSIMGSLKQNYALTDEQIQKLIQSSADLAAVKGTSLVDAAERVQAAIRGEGESAERLGLTMNQAAIDAEGLTLTMSNADAAAFRYAAFMDQAAYATGAAGDQLDTTTGQTKQFVNQLQDMGQKAVAATGPVGEIVAGLSSMSGETALAAGGIVQVGRAIVDMNKAAGGVGKLGTAFSALSTAIGPAGLIAVALAAGYGVLQLAKSFGSDLDPSMSNATESANRLDESLSSLSSTMGDATLANTLFKGDDPFDERLAQLEEYKQALADIAKLPPGFANLDNPESLGGDRAKEYAEYVRLTEVIQQYADAFGDVDVAAQNLTTTQDAYNAIVINSRAGADDARESLANLITQYQSGQITIEEFSKGIIDTAGNLSGGPESYEGKALAAAEANEKMAASFDVVSSAIGKLIAGGADETIIDTLIKNGPDLSSAMQMAASDVDATAETITALKNDIAAINAETGPAFNFLQDALDQLNERYIAGELTTEEYRAKVDQLANEIPALTNQFLLLNYTMQQAAAGNKIVAESLRGSDNGLTKFGETAGQVGPTIGDVTDNVDHMAAAFGNLNPPIKKSVDDMEGIISTMSAMREEAQSLAEYFKGRNNFLDNGAQSSREFAEANAETAATVLTLGSHVEPVHAMAGAMDVMAGGINDVSLGLSSADIAAADMLGTMQDIQSQGQAFTDDFINMAKSLGAFSTSAQIFQQAGLGGASIDVAVNLQLGGNNLENQFRALIGNVQQMASQMGSIDSWADKLIGDPGVWSDMDQLLADGRIDVEQYTAAQEAQVDITRDVTNAQQDLLAVQVNQAPVIAAATRRQAEYIDSLQDLDAHSQMVALGYMDQATSAKAMELAQLAATASTDGQKKAFEEMVSGLAYADPVLASVLEDMGLISIGAKGEITVNFDAAEDADKAMTDLTASIDALTIALGGIPPIHIDATEAASTTQRVFAMMTEIDNTTATGKATIDKSGAVAAMNEVQTDLTGWGASEGTATASADNTPAIVSIGGAQRSLGGWDASAGYATVGVVDLATGTLGAVASLLSGINNSTATAYVNTVYTSFGKQLGAATGATINGYAGGGTIGEPSVPKEMPHYLTGGTHALVGEVGPEIVWLPNGSQVTPAAASARRMESGGGTREGDVIFNGPVTLQPMGNDAYTATRQAALSGVRR